MFTIFYLHRKFSIFSRNDCDCKAVEGLIFFRIYSDCKAVALKEYYNYIHQFLLAQKGFDIFEK